jgi:hypothetical protein
MRPAVSTLLRNAISRHNVNRRQRLFQELSSLHEMRGSGSRPGDLSAAHASVQTRQIWGWLSPSKEEEEPPKTDSSQIAMPPRQKQNKIEKKDEEVQKFVEIGIGDLDDATWSKAGALLETLVSHNNIIAAFWLLDRLSKEPDAETRLTKEMVYPVVKQWSIYYASQQRKSHFKARTNKIHHPLTVWRKVDVYISRGVRLTSSTFHRVIDATAYAKVKNLNSKNGPILVDIIVQKMMDLSTDKNSTVRPSRYTFTAAIASWEAAAMDMSTRSDDYDRAAKRSLELLDQLKALYQSGWGHECMPNRDCYMKVMRFFAHQGNGDKVEELMEDMYGMYLGHGEHPDLLPSTEFFSLVFFGWSRSKDPGAAERAADILDRVLEMEAKEEFPGLEVTARSYNLVLICWSRVGTEEALNKMQALFDRMVKLSKSDPSKRPSGATYAALLKGWSQVDPARAEQIVWTWKKEAQLGNCTIRIDAKLISVLIAGWYNFKSPDSPDMCDRLLQNALEEGSEVNANCFNMAINAWCRRKSAGAIDRAEALLRQMQECGEKQNKLSLTPTIFTYAPLIFGYAFSGHSARSEALLREFFEHFPLKERGLTHSSTKSRLDTRVFNGVLKSWLEKSTKDSQAVDRSEVLLLDMPRLEVHPNMMTFDMVLQCKDRHKNSAMGRQTTNSRNDEIIALLDEEFKNGNLDCTLEQYLTKRQAWVLFNA